MDALLDRLWELANQDDEPQTAQRNGRITEARALWRALEVLLSSLNAHDFCVGDGTFTKTLACIRSVLSDSSYWRTPSGVSLTDDDKATSVFVCVNRVLLKVAGRGPKEREALVRDGVADLMVRCCDAQPLHQGYSLSAAEGAAALQTLHALAAEAKSRAGMLVSQTIRLSSQLMQKHESVFAVQLRGCQFLHQMSLEEDSKERIGRQGGLQALTKALMRFPAEKELVVIALDLLLLLCWELEYREGPVQSAQYRSVNSAVLHGLVNGVVSAMRMLKNVELIQANGIAILNKWV
ncbi:hypothetical protein PHYBOEH_005125 [Phytophthora boehmeriae]|uniref:Uncharacterized protein n=1 Tax=Phytophthora boehmeriae TaxID=109152 RepID=A0A8T1X2X9_9STRA|nr:hypothetical protein PHYBOEH_005125 [Phytophthora boehmeriae]